MRSRHGKGYIKTFLFLVWNYPKYCMTSNVYACTSPKRNSCKYVMETISEINRYVPLQYRTVPSIPWWHVHQRWVGIVNTILLYSTVMVVPMDDRQITLDVKSMRFNHKDEANAGTERKPTKFTRFLLYIFGLLSPISDRDVIDSAPISAQGLTKQVCGRSCCDLHL